MKPTAFWLRHLAVAGSCLVWAGCGGGGVPDPSSDPLAATEGASRANSQPAPPPEPEPAPAPAPAPVAVAPTPAPVTTTAPVVADTKPSSPADTTDGFFDVPAKESETAEPTTAEVKGDSSGTDEMLRIGSAPGEPSAATPATDATPAPAGATPAPAMAMADARGGRERDPGGDPSLHAGGAEVANAPGTAMPSRAGAEMSMPSSAAGNPGGGAISEGSVTPGGGFGSGGDSVAGGEELKPDSFLYAGNAVNAFLTALKAKNKDQLSQATARRAATEAVEKHRKVFAAILEQSVSDEQLDDMAKSLDGFKVMGTLPAKSTGQQGVLIGKMEGRDRLQRTVVVRREKEGWKVMDIGNTIDFKPMGTYRRPYGRR